MSEPTIRLPRHTYHSRQIIDNCQWLIRTYIKHDAYVEYDCGGAPDPGSHDTLTCRQRDATDGMMHVWMGRKQARDAFWRRWLGQSLSEELRDIPLDLDLIDDAYSRVYLGIVAIRELVSQMAEMNGVGDVAPTKALHLLRPRFVAISDSLVRQLLGIDETQIGGTTDGEWYAARAEAVQRAIRALVQGNAAALDKLHAYANDLPSVTTPLSKARVLDIVLWSHAR